MAANGSFLRRARDLLAAGESVAGPDWFDQAAELVAEIDSLVNAPDAMCVCGHTAYWHTEHDDIPCESVNFVAPGSFVGCECTGFSEAAEEGYRPGLPGVIPGYFQEGIG